MTSCSSTLQTVLVTENLCYIRAVTKGTREACGAGVVAVILFDMGNTRSVNLSHADAEDVHPELATRIVFPQDTDASTIDRTDVPLERFAGRGLVVRVAGLSAEDVVAFSEVREQLEAASPGDIVLFETGWSDKRTRTGHGGDYESRHPTIDPGIIAGLIVRGVLTVGIDTPRLDPPDARPGPGAHLLAAAGGVLLVNLTNLELIDFDDPFITLSVGDNLSSATHRLDATAVEFRVGL